MDHHHNAYGQAVGAPLPHWTEARVPGPTTLVGRYVRLEPVDPARHARALHAAYEEASDEPIWTYLNIGPFASESAFQDHLARIAGSADPRHFALVDLADEQPAGTFALMRIDPPNGVIELGFVVYSPRLRRTRIATEALYLLMRHVFDDLGYRRLEWKCDALNAPSRAAALRYGFHFEGIFRQATVYKGRTRDTAWFSVIDAEWPALRQAYERWLGAPNFTADGVQIERLSDLTRAANAGQ
ncbi:GNAT family protein [Robbsia sp. Bb-Pol-6]|uniref:GNAT family protein n=1 Tax=Robbsia betulipollinis TaxID=2981849 RepID=A0ABT3ZNQ4_9BURK|nr:GNAT family protein [Robbsia betulipollinis]MCY0388179.1 GNAT family protein [Robbsia betulipollinis]